MMDDDKQKRVKDVSLEVTSLLMESIQDDDDSEHFVKEEQERRRLHREYAKELGKFFDPITNQEEAEEEQSKLKREEALAQLVNDKRRMRKQKAHSKVSKERETKERYGHYMAEMDFIKQRNQDGTAGPRRNR